jgi:hypothetical protein
MREFQGQWPNGLSEEVAVVDATIAHIENKLGISFDKDFDDLDWYKYYIFRLDRGNFALMRYDNAPMNGVTIVVEKDHLVSLDDSLSYFLESLNLSDCPIIWRRPQLE